MPAGQTPPTSRRERVRRQTLDEIEELALALVDGHGVHALSMAAIAKAMQMSAPALYRYYPSREALIASLVATAYGQLSAAIEYAAEAGTGTDPAGRLRACADAYRAWATSYPKRYLMMFGERPEDVPDSAEAIAAISRGMDVLLGIVLELDVRADRGEQPPAALSRQLTTWARSRGHTDAAPRALRLAILIWTRIHGIVALEVAGAFSAMGIDGAALLAGEVRGTLDGATSAR